MDLMEHLQGTGTCIYRENKATLYRYTGDEPWKGQQSYKQWLGLSKLDAKIIYIEINDRICWSKAANGTGSFNIFLLVLLCIYMYRCLLIKCTISCHLYLEDNLFWRKISKWPIIHQTFQCLLSLARVAELKSTLYYKYVYNC